MNYYDKMIKESLVYENKIAKETNRQVELEERFMKDQKKIDEINILIQQLELKRI